MKFEEAMTQLDALVKEMENGNLPLEELLKNYQKGSKLLNFCRSELNNFEQKIEQLTRDDGKEGEWTGFNPADGNNDNGELPF